MNDNAKFTPGPYRCEGPDDFGDWNILHPGDALAVAAVVSNMREPGEVAANAHLIAAAPELYTALKAARHALRSYQHGNTATDLAAEVADFASAALAKAEGRP